MSDKTETRTQAATAYCYVCGNAVPLNADGTRAIHSARIRPARPLGRGSVTICSGSGNPTVVAPR